MTSMGSCERISDRYPQASSGSVSGATPRPGSAFARCVPCSPSWDGVVSRSLSTLWTCLSPCRTCPVRRGRSNATRTFEFPTATREMSDSMRAVNGKLVDRIGAQGEIEIELEVHVRDGALHLESRGLALRILGIRLPLPPIVKVNLREAGDSGRSRIQHVQLEITMRRTGAGLRLSRHLHLHTHAHRNERSDLEQTVSSSFTIETRTSVPVTELFDVSLSIDEHLASMGRSGEQAIAGVTHGSIGLGETVTWRARHFGIWFTMTSQITALERPSRFVDEQVQGPFRCFRHEHSFTRDGHATVMIDTLTISSPISSAGSPSDSCSSPTCAASCNNATGTSLRCSTRPAATLDQHRPTTSSPWADSAGR